MSIEKEDALTMIKRGHSYTSMPNSTIELIKNSAALGVWCYLMTKPDNWVINKTQLMAHFGVGRDKMISYLSYLRELKLIKIIKKRDDETGKLCGDVFILYSEPFDRLTENSQNEFTGLLKNRTPVPPDAGKTAPSNNIYISNTRDNSNSQTSLSDESSEKNDFLKNNDEEETTQDKKPRKRQLSKNWQPTEKHAAKAKELGLNLNETANDFRDYHHSKGSLMLDWDLAFNTWLRNAKKFKPIHRQPESQNRPVSVLNGSNQGLNNGKLGFTGWQKQYCREMGWPWRNDSHFYEQVGYPEDWFRNEYRKYLEEI